MLTPRRAVLAVGFLFIMFFMYSHSGTSTSIRTASKSDVPPSAEQKAGALKDANDLTNTVATQVKVTKPQKPLDDTSKMTLLDKLAYQFPYDMEAKDRKSVV